MDDDSGLKMARKSILSLSAVAVVLAAVVLTSCAATYIYSWDPAPELAARTMQGNYTASINVTVVDNVGRKIPDANVKIVGNASNFQTKADGTVLIQNLDADAGNYTLWANKSRYRDSEQNSTAVGPDQTSYINLTLVGGTILGTVTSGSSAVIPGAAVSISALEFSVGVSPSDGSYRLDGIPAGTHSVTASAPGYSSKSQDVRLAVAGAALANFVLFSQNGSISGHVYHSELLTPLNNSRVSVTVGSVTLTVTSSPDGSYNITNLPEGTYSVTASKDGFDPNTTTGVVVTRGNKTEGVDFYLTEKPTLLHGTVKSGSFLVPAVNVTVFGTGMYNLTDSAGEYEIHNLTAGVYTVIAFLEGYEPRTITGVALPAGGEVRLNIDLVGLPGAILRGTVKGSDTEQPLNGVTVTIMGQGMDERQTGTNIYGQFEFTNLPAGNYTLQLEKDDYKPLEVDGLEVLQDAVTNRTFTLSPIREAFGGFFAGLDLAHSMMLIALALTIVIFMVALYLRIRTFMAPESAPAVYDQAEEEKEEGAEGEEGAEDNGRGRRTAKGNGD